MTDKLDWAGRVGDEWADKADALDGLLGPFGTAAMDRLGEITGKRVLDLGCGAGATTMALAARGALVTGVDVSEALLDVARTRDPQMKTALILGDAAEVEYARRFDGIFSRCGSMFFAEPVAAFRHLRAYMRGGAALAMAAWTEPLRNDWAVVPLDLARSVLGEARSQPSPSGVPGPFAWADAAVFKPILAQAGWAEIEAERVAARAVIGAGDDPDPVERAVVFLTRIGVLASRLRDLPPEQRAAVKAALREGLAPYVVGDQVELGGEAWVITARA